MWFFLGMIAGALICEAASQWLTRCFPKVHATNKLDAAQLVDIIDSRMGDGWVESLADSLK